MKRILTKVTLTHFMAVFLYGCGGGESGREPFERFGVNTIFNYQGSFPYSNQGKAILLVTGEEQIGGRVYKKYKIALDVSSAEEAKNPDIRGPEILMKETAPGKYEVGGARIKLDNAQLVIDPPIVLDANWKTGENQTINVVGKATSNTFTQPQDFKAVIVGRIVADGEIAKTSIGDIGGCRHFSGTVNVEQGWVPGVTNNKEYVTDVWYHPVLGIVKIVLPELGIDGTMSGESDYGDLNAVTGPNTVRKTAILAGINNTFVLSTKDRVGKMDADKNQHAKMLLELRWAEEDQARNHAAPDPSLVRVTFGTFEGMFYFPHLMVESPDSLLHPEENGLGFKYWYAFVDQAAKNQPFNGITYDIIVEKDPTLPPLRVSARIKYHLWQE